jgi:uncharacterized RDD family membrane protein YckC
MRCGRRPGDTLMDRGGVPIVNGALATQLRTQPDARVVEMAPPEKSKRKPNLANAVQTSFFQPANVIPMPPPPRVAAKPRPRAQAQPINQTQPQRPQRRAKPAPAGQGTLDFLPAAPAKPRQLGTTVDAVIYCDAPVATNTHRAVATALDSSMVVLAYVMVVAAYIVAGGGFDLSRSSLIAFAGMFLLTGLCYGFLFAWTGADTPGMRWTGLTLTTFEGFPPDRRQRLVRFLASCLNRCTFLGMLWLLLDEESLGWHDHISRTFPTHRESRTLAFHVE